ncbi:hypothetical protein KBC03_01130 [Patescibacteria group bacterium]|nr:hypothetical protein [Patescibacteria group bacterium]
MLKRAETDKLSQNVEEDLSQENGLDNIESEIIKKIAMLSDMMIKANEEHEPSILVDYVYALTQHFNTLYSTKKYLSSSKLGVRITKGYINVMANVLKVFNIQPLERM